MRQLKIQKSITNRSSEALDKYLVEIGRAPLISIDEEIELAQKIRKGGPAGERAKEKLVTANLRFVVSVAKQYQHQGLTLTDLIDEGNIGLIKAAQKFDETRGSLFPAGCRGRAWGFSTSDTGPDPPAGRNRSDSGPAGADVGLHESDQTASAGGVRHSHR